MRPEYHVDDQLYVNYAASILKTGWLGEYSDFTLNKAPMFGIFLAFCKVLSLPYMMAIGLCYSLASIVFFFAIRKAVHNDKIAFTCYLFVLFSPITMHFRQTEVYRNSLIPIFVLIVVSCLIALYFERESSLKEIAPWAIGCGLAFGAFYLTREDSIWLLFLVVGGAIVISAKLLLEQKGSIRARFKDNAQRIVCFCLPLVLCFGMIQVVKLVNYVNYGVYVVTDFNDTYYARAMSSILQIEPDEEVEGIPVTRSTIQKLYEVSPTFATIESEMEDYADNVVGEEGGESSYGVWLLRWGASEAGVYSDAVTANEFWKQVYEDVEAAFDDGRLSRREGILLGALSSPFEISDIDDILTFAADGLLASADYSMIEIEEKSSSTVFPEGLELMSVITSSIPVTETSTYQLLGWIVPCDSSSEVSINIVWKDGTSTELELSASDDVYEYYLEQGVDDANLLNVRFGLDVENFDIEEATLTIYIDGEDVYSVPLDSLESVQTDQFVLTIDENTYEEEVYSQSGVYAGLNVDIANLILRAYQVTGLVLAVITLVEILLELALNIRFKAHGEATEFSLVIVKLGLLGTILVDVLIVSINYYSKASFDPFCRYTIGIYPIWQVLICLCLSSIVTYAKERTGKRMGNKEVYVKTENFEDMNSEVGDCETTYFEDADSYVADSGLKNLRVSDSNDRDTSFI